MWSLFTQIRDGNGMLIAQFRIKISCSDTGDHGDRCVTRVSLYHMRMQSNFLLNRQNRRVQGSHDIL